jgi:DNA-binding beta-propeller fold protein YncE
MFVVGVLQPTSIQEYSLSTPWEVNSATSTASVSILAYEQYANGIAFRSDGMVAFIAGTENTTLGTGNDLITAINLQSPWSIASVSLRETFELDDPAVTPHDVAFKTDGTEMYVPDLSSSSIMQYSIG